MGKKREESYEPNFFIDYDNFYDYVDYTVDITDIIKEERAKKKMKEQKELKSKKKKKRHIKFFIVELLLIVILGIVLVIMLPNTKEWLINSPLGKFLISKVVSEEDYDNIYDETFNKGDVDINQGVEGTVSKEYLNIALFGVDARTDQMHSGVNSDSIIIASINKTNKTVKLCSVYRDTWLRVALKDGAYDFDKINSAYCFGGPQQAVKTLNANFDLNITDYVAINFGGLANIIDKLGGMTINISKSEKYWINEYLKETKEVTGMNTPNVKSYGEVKLTGLQVVAYCRIRYVKFTSEDGTVFHNDFGRTARQRYVIMKLVDLIKGAGVSKTMDVADEIFNGEEEFIYTSIEYDDIIELIPLLMDFSITGTSGYPYDYETPESMEIITGDEVDYPIVIKGLADNNKKLHEFLFDKAEYEPSNTVIKIENKLEQLIKDK